MAWDTLPWLIKSGDPGFEFWCRAIDPLICLRNLDAGIAIRAPDDAQSDGIRSLRAHPWKRFTWYRVFTGWEMARSAMSWRPSRTSAVGERRQTRDAARLMLAKDRVVSVYQASSLPGVSDRGCFVWATGHERAGPLPGPLFGRCKALAGSTSSVSSGGARSVRGSGSPAGTLSGDPQDTGRTPD